mmetsp:Transcript_1202/g.2330  ORF Transcript_1202/g.2330 Transcript_1202/m.2330 type:complete len:270 (-) Transcript_1202:194-1003(-)
MNTSSSISFRYCPLSSLQQQLLLLLTILSTSAANTMTSPSPITVHFLQLSTTADEELRLNPDLHRVLWQLTDLHRPPSPSTAVDDTSTTATTSWPGIAEGDLVVFPALLTGAGEFEGMKFVGPKSAILWSNDDDDDDEEEEKGGSDGVARTLPLLTAGIEYPEFPVLVANMAKERDRSLRDMYEVAFDVVLGNQTGKFTLKDLLSGDDEAVERFWRDPPMARRRGPVGRGGSGSPWSISLGECEWIRSVVAGKGDESGPGSKQKEEPDL